MIDPTGPLKLFWLLFGAMVMAVFSICHHAHAYVPRTMTILEKTAKFHGQGAFKIDQEVTFSSGENSLTINQSWTVLTASNMSLEASGDGVSAFFLYSNNQRYFLDQDGAERASALSNDFFEDFFHYRGSSGLLMELQHHSILPADVVKKVSRPSREPPLATEPNLRLSRQGGVVTYAFGRPTPPDSSEALPGIWIEQDRFVIRRIRLPSSVDVQAEDYSEYPRNLRFPKFRIVSWGSKIAHIRTMRVTPISDPKIQQKLQPSVVRAQKRKQLRLDPLSPLAETVKEFYTRFR